MRSVWSLCGEWKLMGSTDGVLLSVSVEECCAQQGLRHLVVTDTSARPVGMVTRIDLTPHSLIKATEAWAAAEDAVEAQFGDTPFSLDDA